MPQLRNGLRKEEKRVYSARWYWLMNVLVIGDEHTYGFGLSGGSLNYIGHFIRQIRLAGQAVSVESYAHLTMPQLSSTLAHLPLNRYDLIILQLDHTILQPTAFVADSVPCLTTPVLPYCLEHKNDFRVVKQTPSTYLRDMGWLLGSFVLPFHKLALSVVLQQLRSYRHNVIILTPFPSRERPNQWLRQRSRALLLKKAEEQLFSVFDTDAIIRPHEEYFLANDSNHLNAVSHELIGRALFDFYLSAPTIVTIQSIRR